MPKVSYIVPSHNGEKYLESCIKSIVREKQLSCEIIIVENGSTDNTLEKAKELSLIYENVFVYQSQGGVSNARNLGIEKATGEWVCFVDQDDTLIYGASEVFKNMIENYENSNLLFAYSKSQLEEEEDKCVVFKSRDYLAKALKNPTQTLTAWAKLFRRSFLIENNIRFNPELSHAEDSDFVISTLLNSEHVLVEKRMVYNYYVNENSAVHSKNISLTPKYILALEESRKKIKDEEEELRNAFELYILDHLLICAVHDIFKKDKGGYFAQMKLFKETISNSIFKIAISRADLNETTKSKRLVYTFLKMKMYFVVYLAVKFRQLQKNYK